MREKKTHSVSSLGEILPKVLKGLESKSRLSREAVQKVWKQLVGAKAALHSWPRSLVRGRLLVEVENSGWMYALGIQKEELLQRLRESLGSERVQELMFRIGEKKDA